MTDLPTQPDLPPPPAGQRRLLILASDLAPSPSVGRLRVQKFCKYLPRHGWQVRVITFQPTYGADAELLSELPADLPVDRVTVPHLVDGMIALAKRVLLAAHKGTRQSGATLKRSKLSLEAWGCPGSTPKQTTLEGGTNISGVGTTGVSPVEALDRQSSDRRDAYPTSDRRDACRTNGGFLDSASRLVDRVKKCVGRTMLIPDENMIGIAGMAARAVGVIRRWRPSAMLVSVPGFSPMIAAAWAHLLTGTPLIADYRDLWHGDVLREWIGPVRSRLELAMERWCLRQCRAITAVTKNYLAEAQAVARGGRFSRPGRWITNGFDPDDFSPDAESAPAPRPAGPGRPMEILHAGRLFKNRTADALLTAIGDMKAGGKLAPCDLRVTFLGEVEPAQMARLSAIVARFGLADMIAFGRYVTRRQCLAMEHAADCLLVIGNEGRKSSGTMSMKLFEYAGAGRCVLALLNEGEGRDFVHRSGIGRTAPISDATAIAGVLSGLLDDWRAGKTLSAPDAEFLRRYRFDEIAGRLADFLDTILERP